MGTTFKPIYASDVALTMTSLASLTNNSYASCAVVDNTTNLYEDALVSVVIATGASGVTSTGNLLVYAYGTTNGSNYTDGVAGTDATVTPTSPTNLRLIGIVSAVATSTTYRSGPFSVARAFGGILPQKWGIVVQNVTGGTLASSGSSADYQGYNESIP